MGRNRTVDPIEIETLYKSGLSLRQVAGRVGVTLQRIHQILVVRDIPRRPMHITRHHPNYTGIKAME